MLTDAGSIPAASTNKQKCPVSRGVFVFGLERRVETAWTGSQNGRKPFCTTSEASRPKGERGISTLPADFLLRMRYNPFYSTMEARILDWLTVERP